MRVLALLLVLSIGVQANATELDAAFQSFLKSASTARSAQDNTPAIKSLYDLYQKQYNPQAKSLAEKTARFAAFKETVTILLEDNKKGGKTYTVGLNEFSDKGADELKNSQGLKVPQGDISQTNAKPDQKISPLNPNGPQGRAAVTLPATYDYTMLVITGTRTPIVSEASSSFRSNTVHFDL